MWKTSIKEPVTSFFVYSQRLTNMAKSNYDNSADDQSSVGANNEDLSFSLKLKNIVI